MSKAYTAWSYGLYCTTFHSSHGAKHNSPCTCTLTKSVQHLHTVNNPLPNLLSDRLMITHTLAFWWTSSPTHLPSGEPAHLNLPHLVNCSTWSHVSLLTHFFSPSPSPAHWLYRFLCFSPVHLLTCSLAHLFTCSPVQLFSYWDVRHVTCSCVQLCVCEPCSSVRLLTCTVHTCSPAVHSLTYSLTHLVTQYSTAQVLIILIFSLIHLLTTHVLTYCSELVWWLLSPCFT